MEQQKTFVEDIERTLYDIRCTISATKTIPCIKRSGD